MKIWENNKINLSQEEKEKLYLCKNSEEELILLFKFIKNRGWIKYERIQGNSDGILGNIFEDLIGINENNSNDADYNEIEIKTKNSSSSSFISLFGKQKIHSYNGLKCQNLEYHLLGNVIYWKYHNT